jgi:tetratricopeptide (TPR) repeat protein
MTEEGVSLFQGEKYAEAIEAFNRSLELRPDYPATLNNRGITHGRMGNHDLALAAYNRSLELRPGDPDTLNARGVARSRIGDTANALIDFTRATRLAPDEALPQFNQAPVLLKLGNQAEAQEALDRVVAIDPSLRVQVKRCSSSAGPSGVIGQAGGFHPNRPGDAE